MDLQVPWTMCHHGSAGSLYLPGKYPFLVSRHRSSHSQSRIYSNVDQNGKQKQKILHNWNQLIVILAYSSWDCELTLFSPLNPLNNTITSRFQDPDSYTLTYCPSWTFIRFSCWFLVGSCLLLGDCWCSCCSRPGTPCCSRWGLWPPGARQARKNKNKGYCDGDYELLEHIRLEYKN